MNLSVQLFQLKRVLIKGLFTLNLMFSLIILTSHLLFAQSTDASIRGIVKDEKAQVIPGATVLIRNESTGFETGTITAVDGRFNFKQLPLGGPYYIAVSYIGYANQRLNGYQLNQGNQINVEITLSESTQELEQVTIQSTSLANQIERLGGSTSVSAREISRLPATNRDFTSLANLAPVSNGTNIIS